MKNKLIAAALVLAPALAGAQLYGPAGVTPQAVRQGSLGSCYFHASVAALAQLTPQTLRSAISPSGSGGYNVQFKDGPPETVFDEDVAYGRSHGFDHSDGNWVLVLMRGYAQRTLRQSLASAMRNSAIIPAFVKPTALSWLDQAGPLLVAYDRAVRSIVRQDGMIDKFALQAALATQLKNLGLPAAQSTMVTGFLNEQGFFDAIALTVRQNAEVFGAYKGVGQGGIPERVIEAFTGNSGLELVSHTGTLQMLLRRLHNGQTALVAGTYSNPPDSSFASTNWWVPLHAYTITDYDESSGTVSIRNPWGSHPSPDGSFTLPLSTFVQAFEQISYSK